VFDMTASNIYGTAPTFIGAVPAQTALSATDDAKRGWRALVDPHNPLLWAGAILLITVGAAGVAGSARVGPAKLSAALGKGG
jgi:hypothetical protein